MNIDKINSDLISSKIEVVEKKESSNITQLGDKNIDKSIKSEEKKLKNKLSKSDSLKSEKKQNTIELVGSSVLLEKQSVNTILSSLEEQLEIVKQSEGEEKLKNIALTMSLIISSTSLLGYTGLESTSLPTVNKELFGSTNTQEDILRLKEATGAFSSLLSVVTNGFQIKSSFDIILQNVKIHNVLDQIEKIEENIKEKEKQLIKYPENTSLKLEISELTKKQKELEESQYKMIADITTNTMNAPIVALSIACEELSNWLPQSSFAGLQRAVSMLSILGSSLDSFSALGEMYQSKENIKNLKSIKSKLIETASLLQEEGNIKSAKILKERAKNLGIGRSVIEVSNLVGSFFKWVGSSGSVTKGVLSTTGKISGALAGKVSIGLTGGGILIPALIGTIAYVGLQRANIWKKFKSSNDQENLKIIDKFLQNEAVKYEKLLHNPFFQFLEKFDLWKNKIDDKNQIQKKIDDLNSEIINTMSDQKFEEWRKATKENSYDQVDIKTFASQEQVKQLEKLNEDYQVISKKVLDLQIEIRDKTEENPLLKEYSSVFEQNSAIEKNIQLFEKADLLQKAILSNPKDHLKISEYNNVVSDLNKIYAKFSEFNENIDMKEENNKLNEFLSYNLRDLHGRINEELNEIRTKINYIENKIQLKVDKQNMTLKNIQLAKNWHNKKLTEIENEFIKRTALSYTRMKEDSFQQLTEELKSLWDSPNERKIIEKYFWENNKSHFGELQKDPISTLVKWTSGIIL